ncbi:MAG: addiction module toxin RelE [Micavibrio sp.]|nr:addiction module toxin RelE [Micavibrio sp.]|tara:strand:+ start:1866 stop:2132 length:267 start_codon:yes stop_codon:yes gene_type:complete
MNLEQKPRFKKAIKKLHQNQKQDLKAAIQEIIKDPSIGAEKKGDLAGVNVYKFKMAKQETLLAYMVSEDTLTLLYLGSHENFYRDLKR